MGRPLTLTLYLCSTPAPASPQVFLEETSLVARPAVDFPDLKERLEARMKWLGIKVGVGGGVIVGEGKATSRVVGSVEDTTNPTGSSCCHCSVLVLSHKTS